MKLPFLCMAAVFAASFLFVVTIATAQNFPGSMASIGDSITRATFSDGTADSDQPEHSWSTGDDGGDIINSHLERIRVSSPGTSAYNNAVAGADSADLLAQSNSTVSQGVEYVTIQMGGNDICGDSTADMPSVTTWEARWNEAIDVLQAGLPGADILVTAVVNVRHLYDVAKNDRQCTNKWRLLGFCDNMLTNGKKQRDEATARLLEYNDSLLAITSDKGVWYDTSSYDFQFTKDQLSTIDCFHPDLTGQRDLAEVTYDDSRF